MMENRCVFLKEDGERCGWAAMRAADDSMCWRHSQSDVAKQARELRAVPRTEREERRKLEIEGISIMDAINSEEHLRFLFDDMDTWWPWFVCLKTIFALPMDEKEMIFYRKCTGRTKLPERPFEEVYLIIGRGGGKSFISALIVSYMALFKDWTEYLKKGTLGWIFTIASDRDQARNVNSYIKYVFQMERYKNLVVRETQSHLSLTNNIAMEIKTASWRGIRGYTVPVAVCDELGFWRSENSANPGQEIINALKPCMGRIPRSKRLLIGISTPHAKKGILFSAFKKYYGTNNPDVLVWRAPTLAMNPTFDARVIERALEDDYEKARAEYFAEFRKDITSPFDPEDIEDVTVKGRKMLSPNPATQYRAFVDPTGGKNDSYTLGIAHGDNGKVVVDRLEEVRSPCNLKAATKDFSQILKEYKCYQVQGDAFGGNWVSSEFKTNGITYVPISKSKSDLYLIFQSLIMSKGVELLENKRASTQLQALERRVHTGGKDTIDHPKGMHDDVANAAAGVAVIMYQDLRIGMTPEFLAQRLPTMAGKEYKPKGQEAEERKLEREVLEEMREEEGR